MKLRKFFAAAMMLIALGSMAQSMPIENDPSVRTGKLANGLTYYIKQNNWPEHRVNFYIAQRVGSLQEEESQRGLAHFLEHMAFNGTVNYPGNGVIDYTRSLGVEFGRDLNAYTGVDQTVYNINDVPSTRLSAIDSCLLILKDWSNGLLLEDKEIDKERGVIHEEWRVRSSASQRMFERNLETLYPGSKYGKRMPIGLMSVVDNFKYDEIRNYYHKWYRPDNQAIVVVGDIDVDRTEAKIKEMFSSIPGPAADAAQVVDIEVPDNAEPIFVIDKDKEQQYNVIQVMYKNDPIPNEIKGDISYMVMKYAINMACDMLNKRLEEKALEPDCPYLQAGANYGNYIFAKTKDAFNLIVLPKDGKSADAVQVVTQEALRASQHGFTATEYVRAKDEYMSSLEKQFNNRNQINNDRFGREYCSNFLEKEPYPSIEWEHQMMSMIAPNIQVEMINQLMEQMMPTNDSNLVVMNFNPDKEGVILPTKEALKGAIDAAQAAKLEAYVDNVKNEPLIAELPTPGKIVSETENTKLGFKELTLSNGATVILKKTDFKDDEIRYYAESKGGSSLYGPKDWANCKMFDLVVAASGLGNFSSNELEKALAGKNANVDLSLTTNYERLNGNSTKKDLETMFQLNYLYFTALTKDEKATSTYMSFVETQLKNKSGNPDAALSDSIQTTTYNHDWREKPFNLEDIKNVNYDRVIEIAKERTANAADFTFYFVGSFDEDVIKPLIEQYIASLPAQPGVKENFKEGAKVAAGNVKNVFSRAMETPQTTSLVMWHSYDAPYTMENDIKADIAGQVLDVILLKKVREDEGAAYSPHGSAGMTIKGDKPFTQALTYVSMKPEKKDLVINIMRESINDVANGQIEADALQKIKEKMLKDYDTNAKSNAHWVNVLNMYKAFNVDTQNGYKEAVNKVTAADVSKFVKETLVKSNNCIEVTMNPEGVAKEPAKAQPAKNATAKKATAKKGAKKAKGKKRK
ncbi:MAG: insulinase family protein [Muribaculaceae bacterium]|nr:insulinase family protein [Muribaculaceae bacterium]MDY6411987.1 insulinase family protein [Bacteroidales bacterium]